MSWKREPCRNFQRGSCRYGDRCKFLHVTQQQSKPSNPFGFASGSTSQFSQQQQQQQPNPFGFGVQSGSQLKGASAFGAKFQSQTQQKPFENKWIRPTNSTPHGQDTQPRTVDHKCTDPESCKRLIAEDLSNERPLWKLTCYGHFKSLPCDVFGDISYEELRAAAYEDARRGLALQSIVEGERNLLNSKLIEFDSLLQNPYVIAQSPATAGPSPFPAVNNNASSPFPAVNNNASPFPGVNNNASSPFSGVNNASSLSAQGNMPPQAFSFGQLGTATNLGPSIRSPSPNITFGQPSTFQTPNQTTNVFEMKQQTPGLFGGQMPKQQFGGSSGPNAMGVMSGISATQSSPISAFPTSPTNTFSFVNADSQTPIASVENKQDDGPKGTSIWLKEKWAIKEIPEEEPPPRFCL